MTHFSNTLQYVEARVRAVAALPWPTVLALVGAADCASVGDEKGIRAMVMLV
jgi:hypothetical protein